MPYKIILLIGPSGSGKTTLGKKLEEKGFFPLVSYTTRNKRPGERFGEDYYFVPRENFPKEGFVETTEYNNELYGLTEREVRNKSNMGHTYLVCDEHGASEMIKHYSYQAVPFFLNVKPSTALARMKKRGDKTERVLDRMAHAVEKSEFTMPKSFDCYEINGEASTDEQVAYIEKIILKRVRGVI